MAAATAESWCILIPIGKWRSPVTGWVNELLSTSLSLNRGIICPFISKLVRNFHQTFHSLRQIILYNDIIWFKAVLQRFPQFIGSVDSLRSPLWRLGFRLLSTDQNRWLCGQVLWVSGARASGICYVLSPIERPDDRTTSKPQSSLNFCSWSMLLDLG